MFKGVLILIIDIIIFSTILPKQSFLSSLKNNMYIIKINKQLLKINF